MLFGLVVLFVLVVVVSQSAQPRLVKDLRWSMFLGIVASWLLFAYRTLGSITADSLFNVGLTFMVFSAVVSILNSEARDKNYLGFFLSSIWVGMFLGVTYFFKESLSGVEQLAIVAAFILFTLAGVCLRFIGLGPGKIPILHPMLVTLACSCLMVLTVGSF